MCDVPPHVNWLIDTGERITTVDGKTVDVWEFRHQPDDTVLSAWAKHFRSHYCDDGRIDKLRRNTGYSRADYLLNLKFPDPKAKLGPSTRAGDFGEILVADYLQYHLKFLVPLTRYDKKATQNESTKGCDVIGFKFLQDGKWSDSDVLAIFEVKTQFSGRKPNPRLQDAVEGSKSDPLRKGFTLNALKQRFDDINDEENVIRVERFQRPADNPYEEIYGVAALFSSSVFDVNTISGTSIKDHGKKDNLFLLVIRGENMMELVHQLYQRAADEA
jgi:hypothetical protein